MIWLYHSHINKRHCLTEGVDFQELVSTFGKILRIGRQGNRSDAEKNSVQSEHEV